MDDDVLPHLEDASFQELLKQFTNQEFEQQAELAQWHPDTYILKHANDADDPSLPALPPADADAGEYNPQWKREGAEMISKDIEHISVEQPFHIRSFLLFSRPNVNGRSSAQKSRSRAVNFGAVLLLTTNRLLMTAYGRRR